MPSFRALLSTRAVALVTTALLAAPAPGTAGEPTDLPVLSRETPRGTGTISVVDPIPPAPKTIDGDISDWVGNTTGFGGTAVYSGGEYVYQDHLFDAHGPDDGRDASKSSRTDPLEEAVPEAYRLDGLGQADPAGEFGAPVPAQFRYNDSYGDAAPHVDAADILEARVAADDGWLYLLLRTTTMAPASRPGVLLLAGERSGGAAVDAGFNSGLTTETGATAVFLSRAGGTVRDLATGEETALAPGSVAVDDAGYRNALEARIPLAAVTSGEQITLALATGTSDADGAGFAPLPIEMNDGTVTANVANVAFRFDEPVRVWFEKKQALSLYRGSIDPFFTSVSVAKLHAGTTEAYEPGPGYHDRIFVSTPNVATENGRDGLYQHYGIYLPSAYDGGPLPLQWWLHWRGGKAHTAGGFIPKMFKQFGEDLDTLVVSPSGRGTGRWYVGKGHVDVLQVWDDVFDTFAVDENRVYVTGHSMGGFGTFLMTVLYPDRFAAGVPVSPPVTQGAWTGLDFPGCDGMRFQEYTPCYIEANGGRARQQHTRKLLDNLRWTPLAIFHGVQDELVPYAGVARQSERLIELGYRHRMYTYPVGEHYTPPVLDQWAEVARYEHLFTRPENPPRVTYKRDMLFELATEQVQSDGVPLNFDFDRAYWMSELTPADASTGVASFDGRSLALPSDPYLVAPDTDAPTAVGQTGPYLVTGLQWLDDPTGTSPDARNEFDVTLAGSTAVRLDLARMGIDIAAPLSGRVSTDTPLGLRLDGEWLRAPEVTVDEEPAAVTVDDGVLTVPVPAGVHNVAIAPAGPDPTESPTESPTGSPTGDPEPEEQPTSVTFTEASAGEGQYSDDTFFEAALSDVSGDPIAGADVTFELVGEDGGRTFTARTDDDGAASVSPTLTERPGPHQLTVRYAGEEGRYEASAATTGFVVSHEDTTTALSVTGNGAKRRLTATLTDPDDDGGVAGRTIEFFVDDRSIGEAVTDDDGVATLSPAGKDAAGKKEYTASFAGDDYYLSSSATRSS